MFEIPVEEFGNDVCEETEPIVDIKQEAISIALSIAMTAAVVWGVWKVKQVINEHRIESAEETKQKIIIEMESNES